MLPIRLRKSKSSYAFVERDAETLLFAEANGQECKLTFSPSPGYPQEGSMQAESRREEFDYPHRLKKFEDLVSPTGKFLRVHRSFIVRKDAIADCGWLFAILYTGDIIPLSRKMYPIIKKLVHP